MYKNSIHFIMGLSPYARCNIFTSKSAISGYIVHSVRKLARQIWTTAIMRLKLTSCSIMTEPSILDAKNTSVDKVKAEGDGFFANRQYRKAYAKYSEAIKLDGQSAVLYANRAASALSMKECVFVLCVVK